MDYKKKPLRLGGWGGGYIDDVLEVLLAVGFNLFFTKKK